MTSATPASTVSRAGVWAFGAVALPLSTIGLPLTIYLAPFYAGEMGLSLAALGTAMVLARILDIVVDPFIGSMSDRLHTRFGRRKPWLVLGAAVLLVGMVRLFHPPVGVTLSYFLFWLGVMYVGYSLVQVPHRAWGAELSPHYDERTHISSVRQFFATGGLIVSTLVPALVLGQKGATSADVLSSLASMTLTSRPTRACRAPRRPTSGWTGARNGVPCGVTARCAPSCWCCSSVSRPRPFARR
jgi:glycoside/pentoside/hexuronide:cation symporter, GPH family